MNVKTYLVVPIFGDPLPGKADDSWPPNRYIVGWKRPDTGEEKAHNYEWGVGAMWHAIWMPRNWDWDNETGPHLLVRCPNGAGHRDWDIDSRASNCGLPKDKLHRCWCRHGKEPVVTVNKMGVSCNAGAGSISLPEWHGFLTNGELIRC